MAIPKPEEWGPIMSRKWQIVVAKAIGDELTDLGHHPAPSVIGDYKV